MHVECPGRFRRELKVIFPVVDPANVQMIPTCQKAEHDLTDWGDTVETEKERLLERVSCQVLCTVSSFLCLVCRMGC